MSSSRASEVGPSFFKGRIVFGRLGAGNGLFVADRGEGARRISITPALETDVYMGRIIARTGSGTATAMLLIRADGRLARIVDRAGRVNGSANGPRLTSPAITRYRAFWLQTSQRDASYVAKPISTRSVRDRTQTASRSFAVAVNGLALGPKRVPQLTSGGPGIQTIAPLLRFSFLR